MSNFGLHCPSNMAPFAGYKNLMKMPYNDGSILPDFTLYKTEHPIKQEEFSISTFPDPALEFHPNPHSVRNARHLSHKKHRRKAFCSKMPRKTEANDLPRVLSNGQPGKGTKNKKVHYCYIGACEKCYTRAEHLRRHEEKHHIDERPITCRVCPADFWNLKAYQDHRETCHPPILRSIDTRTSSTHRSPSPGPSAPKSKSNSQTTPGANTSFVQSSVTPGPSSGSYGSSHNHQYANSPVTSGNLLYQTNSTFSSEAPYTISPGQSRQACVQSPQQPSHGAHQYSLASGGAVQQLNYSVVPPYIYEQPSTTGYHGMTVATPQQASTAYNYPYNYASATPSTLSYKGNGKVKAQYVATIKHR